MQILEQSPGRLVIESRRVAFRALGTVLLLVPVVGAFAIARSIVEWLQLSEVHTPKVPLALLLAFGILFAVGLLLIVYGPYRVTHSFDRARRAYVKESTSVRRTRRVELPLDTFRAVEVEQEEEGGYRVLLVDNAGQRLPLGDPAPAERAQMDAVADLVEAFLTTA